MQLRPNTSFKNTTAAWQWQPIQTSSTGEDWR